MAQGKVLTGAIAVIKKNGTVIGRMRNIRWTENTRTSPVQGIGTVLTQELPVVQHGGTGSCDFYEIDFASTGLPGGIRRDMQNNQEFEDNLLFREPLQIDIFKKEKDVVDVNTGKIRTKLNPYAILRDLFIESDGADITEGAVSGHNQGFVFLSPTIFPS